jgi:hypothetical protein
VSDFVTTIAPETTFKKKLSSIAAIAVSLVRRTVVLTKKTHANEPKNDNKKN